MSRTAFSAPSDCASIFDPISPLLSRLKMSQKTISYSIASNCPTCADGEHSKILMLVNYRPEYSHQWNSKTYYTQLRLDPLGKENAEEMLSALLGDGKDLIPLKRLIIARTEGTPFFME